MSSRTSTGPSVRSRAAETSVTKPIEVASSLGLRRSGWLKVGDGRWTGTIHVDEGVDWEVEELASSWKVIDETGKTSSARTLELALKSALRTRKGTR